MAAEQTQTSEMLEAALGYARLGLPVLPLHSVRNGRCSCDERDCRSPGKHPRVAKGFQGATTDELTIRRWWKRWPESNVGIRLDGLVSVAPDSPEFLAEFRGKGLPETAYFESGGGPGHEQYLYRRPQGCPERRLCKPGRYDILSAGYIVAPPSVHASGKVREWVRPLHSVGELPEAPGWAVQMLQEAKKHDAKADPTEDPSEPPVRLGREAMRWWTGELKARKPDGGVDRSETLWAIGRELGKAGATRRGIADALAERDRTLGYNCYPDRPEQYAVIAEKVLEAQKSDKDRRPILDAGNGDIHELSEQVWGIILTTNDPERLFRQTGQPVRVEDDDDGRPVIARLDMIRLRNEVAKQTLWERQTRYGPKRVAPPGTVIHNMLGRDDIPLPVLSRIVSAPIYAADGTLLTDAGYHPAARVYYHPDGDLTIQPVSSNPTRREVDDAVCLIRDELLVDFPFVGDAEKAHAIAAMLLPFGREFIEGPTPLHVFEAPAPGTGKGLLAQVITIPALGTGGAAVMAATRDDEEWRKRITTALSAGSAAVLIDNITGVLDSGALAAALTATEWEDRRLGSNEKVRLPVRQLWLATGNNLSYSGEIFRRVVRCRIDTRQDRPYTRRGFQHELPGWADEHRGELIHACLTLWSAWLAAGRPSGNRTLGSFESWARTTGGVLEVSRIPGFLGNVDEVYEEADAESARWRALLDAWWHAYGPNPVKAAQLLWLAQATDGFVFKKNTEDAMRQEFGLMLRGQKDRVYGPMQIESVGKDRTGAVLWRLKHLDNAAWTEPTGL